MWFFFLERFEGVSCIGLVFKFSLEFVSLSKVLFGCIMLEYMHGDEVFVFGMTLRGIENVWLMVCNLIIC